MKVYVAYGGWNGEGFEAPIGVYTSNELAHSAIQAVEALMRKDPNVGKPYDFVAVHEYELDPDGLVLSA